MLFLLFEVFPSISPLLAKEDLTSATPDGVQDAIWKVISVQSSTYWVPLKVLCWGWRATRDRRKRFN
jgi:hypothetical protein